MDNNIADEDHDELTYIMKLEAENERLHDRVVKLANFGAANHITLDLLRQGLIEPDSDLVLKALQLDGDL